MGSRLFGGYCCYGPIATVFSLKLGRFEVLLECFFSDDTCLNRFKFAQITCSDLQNSLRTEGLICNVSVYILEQSKRRFCRANVDLKRRVANTPNL